MIPRTVRKILIVRLSARGDLVFASPLAGALRRRYPNAHIAWAAEEHTADVIRHNPHLDEVIVWERAAWRRMLRTGRWGTLARAVADLLERLRDARFDVALDAQGLLRSGVLTFLTGAPVRIGLGSREGSRALMTRVAPRGGDARRIASEYVHLAEALGLDTRSFPLEIPRSADEVEGAARVVEREGLQAGFVAVCPFTTRFHKHWLEERWSEVIRRLRADMRVGVAMLGGPSDREAADRILAGAGVRVAGVDAPGLDAPGKRAGVADTAADVPVVDLVGRTTLGEAAALVSRCGVLVGVDTGLSHMAHAYGRPAVLLFGSNTPYLDPPGPGVRILHSGRDCSPCRGKLTCDGRVDCMRDITVDEVVGAVGAVLGLSGPVVKAS
ncbi:MAG: glycosyltransferase family 9 protein [Gemmatimonadota bacterium]|nr:glycosyltransferase family 9 protein [Gemmatimonadota bacterium]